jgi:HAD superfamily hydrolase (TIGR01549 family)
MVTGRRANLPVVRAVLFDLFGTLVHFAPRLPAATSSPSEDVRSDPTGSGHAGETPAGGRSAWRSAMGWLRQAAERELPDVRFEDVLAALMQVTEEVIRQRPPEYLEVPSRERFRRALVRVGVDGQRASAAAERLSLAHMAYLASTTQLPAGHRAVLQTLAARYRLGLISNFDHGPTARRVLAAHDVERFFEVIVISDGFGRRKPHPAIFRAALHDLGVRAEEAVYVGDSVADDVIGAANAQLAMVWISPQGADLPPDAPQPCAVIRALGELPALLDH